MSGEAVGWAFRKVQMDDPTAKFVLVAICNYADANDKAWPSHNDISRVTGLSKRAVQNSIKKLVDWGIVQREREFRENGSENNPSVYLDLESRPVIKDGVATDATPPVQQNHPGMAPDAILQTTDTKPQKRKDSPNDQIDYSEDFEATVWRVYPRRDGSKKKAFDYWNMLNDANRAKVIAAIPVFAEQMRREGRATDKIPHLTTWFNGRIWENVATTAQVSTPAAGKPFWETATRKDWASALLVWSMNWNWNKMWGPEPGKPGCHVPADILDRFDLRYRGHLLSKADYEALRVRVEGRTDQERVNI